MKTLLEIISYLHGTSGGMKTITLPAGTVIDTDLGHVPLELTELFDVNSKLGIEAFDYLYVSSDGSPGGGIVELADGRVVYAMSLPEAPEGVEDDYLFTLEEDADVYGYIAKSAHDLDLWMMARILTSFHDNGDLDDKQVAA